MFFYPTETSEPARLASQLTWRVAVARWHLSQLGEVRLIYWITGSKGLNQLQQRREGIRRIAMLDRSLIDFVDENDGVGEIPMDYRFVCE
jgi:hypothetical protein